MNKHENELKEYNVIIGISGVASTKIKARNPEEAKKMLLERARILSFFEVRKLCL